MGHGRCRGALALDLAADGVTGVMITWVRRSDAAWAADRPVDEVVAAQRWRC